MGKRSQLTSPRVSKRRHAKLDPVDADYPGKVSETWAAIGSCASSMGIYLMAAKAFDAALVHTPGHLVSLLGWSHALRMNDFAANETMGLQQALQRLTRSAEQFPNLAKSPDFFKELAECYLLVDLNEQAHQAILEAIHLKSTDPAFFLLLAQALIRLGSRAQAASTLAQCLHLLPKNIATYTPAEIETARSAHAELAAIAAADGNIELLISELTETLLLPPPPLARIDEHIALWCALTTANERANKITEALEVCERAQLAVGPLPRILITHAYLLLLDENKANAEKAVSLLTRVVEDEPQLPKKEKPEDESDDVAGDFLPWFLLGKAYTLLDSPRAAYDSYQIALRRASNLPITWLAVGKLYLELKQLPDALAAYSQALRLQLNENSPGIAAAWNGLLCVYERCDSQLGDAADACSRAALCFRSYGDNESADFYEKKAQALAAASKGEGLVPALSEPLGVPNFFLRDIVTLLPSERIAFVHGMNKSREKPDETPKHAAHAAPETPRVHESQDQRAYYQEQYQRPSTTLGPNYEGRLAPRDGMTPGSMPPHTPPQGPHYIQPPPAPGIDRLLQPIYALAYSYKPDTKLPVPHPQQIPQGVRHWQEPQHQAHLLHGPPPMLGQFPPPPAGMMLPPAGTQPQGQHRSPVALPQVVTEGYPVAGPPGYVYGQYVPMHGGMVAQVQPYATNWRQ